MLQYSKGDKDDNTNSRYKKTDASYDSKMPQEYVKAYQRSYEKKATKRQSYDDEEDYTTKTYPSKRPYTTTTKSYEDEESDEDTYETTKTYPPKRPYTTTPYTTTQSYSEDDEGSLLGEI